MEKDKSFISKLKSLLFPVRPDFAALRREGAVIVDVRSQGEYQGGHIKGSLNIPLDALKHNLNKLKKKDHPYILCCASGIRSRMAKSVLTSAGYTNVYNGGGWTSLRSQL